MKNKSILKIEIVLSFRRICILQKKFLLICFSIVKKTHFKLRSLQFPCIFCLILNLNHPFWIWHELCCAATSWGVDFGSLCRRLCRCCCTCNASFTFCHTFCCICCKLQCFNTFQRTHTHTRQINTCNTHGKKLLRLKKELITFTLGTHKSARNNNTNSRKMNSWKAGEETLPHELQQWNS